MFVSAKAFEVIQLVAFGRYRFEPTAILGKCAQGGLATCFVVGVTFGLETRNKIEHLPGLRLGKRAHFVVNVFGCTHEKAVYRGVWPVRNHRA